MYMYIYIYVYIYMYIYTHTNVYTHIHGSVDCWLSSHFWVVTARQVWNVPGGGSWFGITGTVVILDF